MNRNIGKLHPYPFEKLSEITAGIKPPVDKNHIALSIGEPKHQPPQMVLDILKENLSEIAKYPTTKGTAELRESIAQWLTKRFNLKAIDPESQILPVNGTREALFAFAQTVVDGNDGQALVLSPNPFYQIYEGAAFLAGAEPFFLNCLEGNNFHPDYEAVPDEVWQRCQLLYLCTPGNPTGATMNSRQFGHLIELAHKHDFIIASDECYSEIYPDENNPPVGLLQAYTENGNDNFSRCMVFHSLSKRSNLPGLRSGFVAGDRELIKQFFRYRTYHGCAMPLPTQLASIKAWSDEAHVIQNRAYYREKFSSVYDTLKDHYEIRLPEAGFYFWLKTPIADTDFAVSLLEQQNISVLPGRYLSRTVNGINPGQGFVRMAMVAEIEECEQAAQRLVEFSKSLN